MRYILFFIILFTTNATNFCFAQDTTLNKVDTSFFLAHHKGLIGKLGRMMMTNAVYDKEGVPLLVNNATPYLAYQGAIIRKIIVQEVKFGESINDTAFHKKNILTKVADALHASTREKTIRNNLFLYPGDVLFAYLLGDNARFLRELPYLQDARILVKEIKNSKDSVDLLVLYKDVFSIGASAGVDAQSAFMQVQDDNLSGSGDRLQLSSFVDPNRTKPFGYGAEYLKRNINGSFINFTAGYQNMNNAFNNGLRYETVLYSRIELPLVSPYYLWTGSIEAYSRYTNPYYLSDSLYNSTFKYRNQSYDAWVGYNVSAKNMLHETLSRKPKLFIAFRAAKLNFTDQPDMYKQVYNFQYANVTSILASFTVFKQDYYHTSYIYGFGRNEDVPVGYNLSAITGWTDKENYRQPYLGLDLQQNYFNKRQGYFNYVARAGGYFYRGKFQDIGLLLSLESFDRLRKVSDRWYQRNFFSFSYTEQFNTFLNPPLWLYSNYGIPAYGNVPATYDARTTFNYECVFYSRWKVLGFGFAPFVGTSLMYAKPMGVSYFNSDLYTSISAGIRVRNEALVFGTIEFRGSYFPATPYNMLPWNFTLSSELRFKYNSQYVKKPDFISLN
jgi:hypothetical protein